MNSSLDTSSAVSTRASALSSTDRPREHSPAAESDARHFERLLEGKDADSHESLRSRLENLQDDLDRANLHAQLNPSVPPSAQNIAASEVQTPATTSPAQLDDLIARHVYQLAVSDPASKGDQRVMLKLDPSLLPDTELMLARAPEGWVLQVTSRSAEAIRFIGEHGPALERRFRERKLGELRIETQSGAVGASGR